MTETFWKNKPISRKHCFSSKVIIDDLKTRKVYGNTNNIELPESMKWVKINLYSDNIDLSVKLCEFLNTYYSEKHHVTFTIELLKWLTNYNGIIIAIVSKNNETMYGTVCLTTYTTVVFDKEEKFGRVSLLCSHPMFRQKKIAFTLIDEITRIAVQNNFNQGFFMTNRKIARSVTPIQNYYRPINVEKLQKYDVLSITDKDTIAKFTITNKNTIETYLTMTPDHVDGVFNHFNLFNSKYNIHVKHSKDKLRQLLINDIVKSYVILNTDGSVKDFVSYYKIVTATITSGTLFMFSCNNVSGETIISDIVKIANNDDIDVFIVSNHSIISDVLMISSDDTNAVAGKIYEHKFVEGKNHDFLNFFNWDCPDISPKRLGYMPPCV